MLSARAVGLRVIQSVALSTPQQSNCNINIIEYIIIARESELLGSSMCASASVIYMYVYMCIFKCTYSIQVLQGVPNIKWCQRAIHKCNWLIEVQRLN